MIVGMKRITLLLLLLLNVVLVLPAQSADTYYMKTVRIDDMRKHAKGYVVYYLREDGSVQRVFIPFLWFAGNKMGSVYYMNGPANPTMSIFYKNGEIDRIDIILNKDGKLPGYGSPVGETYKDSDFPTKREKTQFVF